MKNLNSKNGSLTPAQMKTIMGGNIEPVGCYECISSDYDPFTGTGSSTTISAKSQTEADAACDGVAHQHPADFTC